MEGDNHTGAKVFAPYSYTLTLTNPHTLIQSRS